MGGVRLFEPSSIVVFLAWHVHVFAFGYQPFESKSSLLDGDYRRVRYQERGNGINGIWRVSLNLFTLVYFTFVSSIVLILMRHDKCTRFTFAFVGHIMLILMRHDNALVYKLLPLLN